MRTFYETTDEVQLLRERIGELSKIRQGFATHLGSSLYDATKDNDELRWGRESLYDGIAMCDAERARLLSRIEALEGGERPDVAEAAADVVGPDEPALAVEDRPQAEVEDAEAAMPAFEEPEGAEPVVTEPEAAEPELVELDPQVAGEEPLIEIVEDEVMPDVPVAQVEEAVQEVAEVEDLPEVPVDEVLGDEVLEDVRESEMGDFGFAEGFSAAPDSLGEEAPRGGFSFDPSFGDGLAPIELESIDAPDPISVVEPLDSDDSVLTPALVTAPEPQVSPEPVPEFAVAPSFETSQPEGAAAADRCPACGAPVQPGNKFCMSCGTALAPRQPVPQPYEEQRPSVCPNCGSPVDPSFKFCMTCGHRL